jgi:hypothetical protein
MALIMMAVGRWPRAGAAAHTPHTHTPRGAKEKKKRRTTGTYLPTFFDFFFEIFRSDFQNICMVFLGSSFRETAKNAMNKNRWEKTEGKKFFFLNFFGQKLLTWTPPKKFFLVFLNSP